MSSPRPDFSHLGFVKSFILPSLLIFLIPILALLFFQHAEGRFDAQIREATIKDIRADPRLNPADREAAIEFFTRVPFSQLINDENIAGQMDSEVRFYYATFRWMIRLSIGSIIAGVAVFVLVGLCVLLSLRSQTAQYWSLLIGWQILRVYGALQTIVLGVLMLALSFWVTALWGNFYSLKLILIVGVVAVIAAGAVILAIFRNPKEEFTVEGVVLDRQEGARLWAELGALCARVGAEPPDQVVAGIDDNFFVTESPVTVGDREYRGKTLFVSLALLKQLNREEAVAVLAHEMAHFSGQDTVYSKKLGPLLRRYETYLQALHDSIITWPVYSFMLCFRALFELSLNRVRRQREFRADQLAAEATSPRDVASALLRVMAYSRFRARVQEELFANEQVMETADVSAQIEQRFPAYAASFASGPDIGEMESSHPFDSHPPLSQRLNALGVSLEDKTLLALLTEPGDGQWRHHIPNADNLERQQWEAFERLFREHHEATLPYRFLPATPEEQAFVERHFPRLEFSGKDRTLTVDFEKVQSSSWDDPVRFSEITGSELSEAQVLSIRHSGSGKSPRTIALKEYPESEQILEVFQRYHIRHLAAVEYQRERKEKKEQDEGGSEAAS